MTSVVVAQRRLGWQCRASRSSGMLMEGRDCIDRHKKDLPILYMVAMVARLSVELVTVSGYCEVKYERSHPSVLFFNTSNHGRRTGLPNADDRTRGLRNSDLSAAS